MLGLVPFIFSSCSNDSDPLDLTPQNGKEYTVNLNIASSLSVSKDPLLTRATTTEAATPKYYISLLQVIAYKETGEVVKDTVITTNDPNSPILLDAKNPNKNSFVLALKLPRGKYTLAVIGDNYAYMMNEGAYESKFVPENFNTDYVDKSTDEYMQYTNGDVYYSSQELTVSPGAEGSVSSVGVILEPMWSSVVINVNSLNTAKIPEGTEYMRVVYNNSYYGFNTKTKLANKTLSWVAPFANNAKDDFILTPISGKDSFTAAYAIAKGIDTSMKISFEFLKQDPVNSIMGAPKYLLLGQKDVTIDNYQFENGIKYTITCNMESIMGSNLNDQPLGISLGTFDEVEIDF